eukprot:2373884-Rhodomonas_salina.1
MKCAPRFHETGPAVSWNGVWDCSPSAVIYGRIPDVHSHSPDICSCVHIAPRSVRPCADATLPLTKTMRTFTAAMLAFMEAALAADEESPQGVGPAFRAERSHARPLSPGQNRIRGQHHPQFQHTVCLEWWRLRVSRDVRVTGCDSESNGMKPPVLFTVYAPMNSSRLL